MSFSNGTVRAAALALLFAAPAFATTYVVDDSGGPGVDFTDIGAAIAAASPGDVLLVRAGTYGQFMLSKGLTILGESGVSTGRFTVSDVPAGEVAVLSQFHVQPSIFPIRIESCLGTVIVQGVTSGKHLVENCLDVRFESVSLTANVEFPVLPPPITDGAALIAIRSRVEVVQSAMFGAHYGADEDYAITGGPGVYAAGPGLDAGSLVHLALTSSTGGRGSFGVGPPGGRGGAGVLVASIGCEVVIAGGNVGTVRGGMGGDALGGGCSSVMLGGPALEVHGERARYSDVALIPGVGCFGPGAQIATDDPSFVVEPAFADPTLAVLVGATPGGVVSLKLRAEPRSKAFLFFGRRPVVVDDGAAEIEQLVDVVRARKLGLVPLSGEVDQSWPIPANAEVGDLFVFQAAILLPTGEYRRTNSLPVIVR